MIVIIYGFTLVGQMNKILSRNSYRSTEHKKAKNE